MSINLCVLLWANDGGHRELVDYEDAVLALLPDAGGRVVQRVRTQGEPTVQPYEVHLLEFPSEQALDAYMQDPRRLALHDRRDRAIARTEILRVDPAEPITAHH
jgi:uncharacterized protein (DUF1330 family)